MARGKSNARYDEIVNRAKGLPKVYVPRVVPIGPPPTAKKPTVKKPTMGVPKTSQNLDPEPQPSLRQKMSQKPIEHLPASPMPYRPMSAQRAADLKRLGY